MSVFLYISGHGFGHASRQIEVINALHARAPGLHVHVVTTAARRLFDRTGTPPVHVHARVCDTGVAQLDSLRLDARETIDRAGAFHRDLPARAAEEARILTDAWTIGSISGVSAVHGTGVLRPPARPLTQLGLAPP